MKLNSIFGSAAKYIATGQVRTVLAAVGGVLVALGVTDTDTVTTTIEAGTTAAGALAVIAAAVGSAINKLRVEEKIEAVAKASATLGEPVDADID